jgi:hypothetical protein
MVIYLSDQPWGCIMTTTVMADRRDGADEARTALAANTAVLDRFRGEMRDLFLEIRGERESFARKPNISLRLLMEGDPPAKLVVLPAWNTYTKGLNCSSVHCEMMTEQDEGGGVRRWQQRVAIRLDGGPPRLVSCHIKTAPEDAGRVLATIGAYLDDRRAVLARSCNNCCICGRLLTDEQSRGRGIGPECIRHFPLGGPAFLNSIVGPETETPLAVDVDGPGALAAHVTGGSPLPDEAPARAPRHSPEGVKATLYDTRADWHLRKEEVMFLGLEFEGSWAQHRDVPVVRYRYPRERTPHQLTYDVPSERYLLVIEGWGCPVIPPWTGSELVPVHDRIRYRPYLAEFRDRTLAWAAESARQVLVDVHGALTAPHTVAGDERRRAYESFDANWERYRRGEVALADFRSAIARAAFPADEDHAIMAGDPSFTELFDEMLRRAIAGDPEIVEKFDRLMRGA